MKDADESDKILRMYGSGAIVHEHNVDTTIKCAASIIVLTLSLDSRGVFGSANIATCILVLLRAVYL